MLREARESGIVDIRVDGHGLGASTLGLELREAYRLEDVYVAQCDTDGRTPRSEMLRLLGRVGAIALSNLIRKGDRLGVAWGETVHALSRQMPPRGRPGRQGLPNDRLQDVGERADIRILRNCDCQHAWRALLYAARTGHCVKCIGGVHVSGRADDTVPDRGAVGSSTWSSHQSAMSSADTHLARASNGDPGRTGRGPQSRGGRHSVLSLHRMAMAAVIRLPPDDRLDLHGTGKPAPRTKRRLLVVGGADQGRRRESSNSRGICHTSHSGWASRKGIIALKSVSTPRVPVSRGEKRA